MLKELWSKVTGAEKKGAEHKAINTPPSESKKVDKLPATEDSRAFDAYLQQLRDYEVSLIKEGNSTMKYTPFLETLATAWGPTQVTPRLCKLFEQGRKRLKEVQTDGTDVHKAYQLVTNEMMQSFSPEELRSLETASREEKERQMRAGGAGMALSVNYLVQDVFTQYMRLQLARAQEAAQKSSLDRAA